MAMDEKPYEFQRVDRSRYGKGCSCALLTFNELKFQICGNFLSSHYRGKLGPDQSGTTVTKT